MQEPEKRAVEKKNRRDFVQELIVAIRAYNAVTPPSAWIGDQEIDVASEALQHDHGDTRVLLLLLIAVAEQVPEINEPGRDVHTVLKQAKASFPFFS